MSPGLEFREGDLLELDLPSGSLAGIVAFYAIVNLPSQQLATAFSEMWRSLEPDGLLLLAFHVGNEIVHPDELWGVALSMAFYMHSTVKIRENLRAAGFTVEEHRAGALPRRGTPKSASVHLRAQACCRCGGF